jgi:putative ABC transport system permease protein
VQAEALLKVRRRLRPAVVRVDDPVQLTEVRQKITELGIWSFSIVDEIDQIRTVFLIIDSVLGLLGGISLLVASFGIANTMIMSILERTREIGIMKAIGAEDREIKLIFFVEAAVIGVVGGVLECWLRGELTDSRTVWLIGSFSSHRARAFIDFFSMPIYLPRQARSCLR